MTPRKVPSALVRDREDAKIIECAHSGHGHHIVSGDKDLLSLKRYRQTKIVSPTKFMRTLRHERQST